MVEIEEGDTTAQHYGLAVDLGKYHCGGETSGLQQWRDFERGQLLQ